MDGSHGSPVPPRASQIPPVRPPGPAEFLEPPDPSNQIRAGIEVSRDDLILPARLPTFGPHYPQAISGANAADQRSLQKPAKSFAI
jgi:hypothetical protein